MKIALNTILLTVIAALAAVLVLGTAAALTLRDQDARNRLRKNDPTPEQLTVQFQRQQTEAFTKIGQLRSSTAPDDQDARAVVIVTPWLAYASGDDTFFEELDTKLRSIRAVIINYFTQYTEDQLLSRGEPLVKADLLERINAELVLGKVTAIYFNDYQFLE